MNTKTSNIRWTEKQLQDFNARIEYMERYIEAFKWESCSKIAAYLHIYGKLRGPQLKEKMQLKGEKSVYRSLKNLLDTKIIDKEYQGEDKRNAFYFHRGEVVHDPNFDKEFISYLIDIDRYTLISDYLTNANKNSMAIIEVVTEIMGQIIKETKNPEIGEVFIDDSIFVETIFSAPNPKIIKNKIVEFIRKELEPLIDVKRGPIKETPKHPAALYLTFLPLKITNKSELRRKYKKRK